MWEGNWRGLRWNLKSKESKIWKQTTRNSCGVLKTGKTVREWVGPLGVILCTWSCQLQGFIQLCVKYLRRTTSGFQTWDWIIFCFFPLYDSFFTMTTFCPKNPFHPFLLPARYKKYILNFPSIFFQYFDNSQLNQMSNLRTNEYMHVHTSGSHYNIKPFVTLKMCVDVGLCESDRLPGCSTCLNSVMRITKFMF